MSAEQFNNLEGALNLLGTLIVGFFFIVLIVSSFTKSANLKSNKPISTRPEPPKPQVIWVKCLVLTEEIKRMPDPQLWTQLKEDEKA